MNGMTYHITLKCDNCGYEYHGKGGGFFSLPEDSIFSFHSISQYYCNTCHNIIDIEHYCEENTETYTYPDGKVVSYDTEQKNNETQKEFNPKEVVYRIMENALKEPPFCPTCNNHLFRLNIDKNETTFCPKCRRKSFKQYELIPWEIS